VFWPDEFRDEPGVTIASAQRSACTGDGDFLSGVEGFVDITIERTK
jgi:hypothetical protein